MMWLKVVSVLYVSTPVLSISGQVCEFIRYHHTLFCSSFSFVEVLPSNFVFVIIVIIVTVLQFLSL